jgi:hypothetical protein
VALEDHHDKGRQNQRASQDKRAELPSNLPLTRARVEPLHDAQDVETREQVEDLEDEVPNIALHEDVEVSCAEHEGVEELGDERDALCRAVSVDGEDENAFRSGV